MKMKNLNLFLAQEESENLLPDLYYDMVLAEGPYPFLFTCTSENERETYLVVCHVSNGEKTEYLVAQRPLSQLIALLKNEITIREALVGKLSKLYVVTYLRGDQQPQVRYAAINELSPRAFPTEGYYMDATEGEFDEELRILEQRLEKQSFNPVAGSETLGGIRIQTTRMTLESGTDEDLYRLTLYRNVGKTKWKTTV